MKKSKWLVMTLIVALILGLFPESGMNIVKAAGEFEVTLSEPGINDIPITITNKNDSTETATATTTDSKAVFESFTITQGQTYLITVGEIIGYQTVNPIEYVAGEPNPEISLVPMDKVGVTGKVIDENATPYSNAQVKFVGYGMDELTNTVTTNTNGEYAMSVYKDKVYTILVTAEDKYEVIKMENMTFSASSSNIPDTSLKIKEYRISANADSNGTIEVPDTVMHGETNVQAKIQANPGYEIENLEISKSGTDEVNNITAAKGKLQYIYKFKEAITNAYEITASFKPMAMTIVPENGGIFGFTNKKVTVKGTVEADRANAKVTKIVWSKNQLKTDAEILASTNNAVDVKEDYSFEFDVEGQANAGTYYLYAISEKNTVGTEQSITVKIDETLPVICGYRYSVGAVLKIGYLDYGTFFNNKMTVTVTAKDIGNEVTKSGVETISLFMDGKFYKKESVDENGDASFLIENTEGKSIKLSAVATDKAGNEIMINDTVAPSDTENHPYILSDYLWIEKTVPTVTVTHKSQQQNSNPVTSDDKVWFRDEASLIVCSEDSESGIQNVKATLNGTLVNEFAFAINEHPHEKVQKHVMTVSTGAIQAKADGSYELEIVTKDFAGNIKTEKKVYFEDKTAPIITKVNFIGEGQKEGSGSVSDYVEMTSYGYYFKKDTTVEVFARDSEPASGVNTITYYLEDALNNTKSQEVILPVNENGMASFVVPADFKGRIYLKATDNVMNTALRFVSPEGTIVESVNEHNLETHISFEKEATLFKDKNGEELYSKNVPVKITVGDTYSGIKTVEWSVKAEYDIENNQSGTLTYYNDKSLKAESDSDWKIEKTDKNLVTQISKTVTLKNNSNDVILIVKMTDWAGNITEKELKLSIDKTDPEISVHYDNNNADSVYLDYYKESRSATIEITERNFKAKDVVFKITNTDKHIPDTDLTKAVSWKVKENKAEPDKTVYTAKINYIRDGDYSFDISYKDKAGNTAKKFKKHKFTIDRTKPSIEVSYNEQDVQNGNYYKNSRTATITVDEHNFDASRVSVDGVAKDDGNSVAFPAIGDWTTSGDKHVAVIHYNSDAEYSFSIRVDDKAGNASDKYRKEEFVVDMTKPNIDIIGVEDKSANNGDVIPQVVVTDTNYDKSTLDIDLVGVNNGKVDYKGVFADTENGQTFTYGNFIRKEEVDDIYALTARLTDKAGNESVKSIVFSVNRFGSVYTFEDSLKGINGQYINKEEEVVFTETNVDTLEKDSIKIKLTKNGTPSDLIEGQDYTVEKSGGKGEWSKYKYTVHETLFANDGRYNIAVYSEDAAGNRNENIDEKKKAEISFGVDKTNPVVVPIDFENDKQYPVEAKNVQLEIKDNLVLKNVEILLDNQPVKYSVQGESYHFTIPEKNAKQDVRIIATDAAGNKTQLSVEDFLVSTNLFVRWYSNLPLFVGTLVVAGLGVLFLVFILYRKKQKAE